MPDAGEIQWPKYAALCDASKNYHRHAELHVGKLERNSAGQMSRKLTTLSIGISDRRLLSQRIPRGNLDRAAELIQEQLGGVV